MNPWRIVLSPAAERDTRKLPARDWRMVADSIDRLAEDPGAADVRKLGGHADEWRLRVGRWRVRFAFDGEKHTIRVLGVFPRCRAYRD